MKCEFVDCDEPQSCFHYCHEHHKLVCAPPSPALNGRELDAAVAERVMGLVPCQSDQHELGAKFYVERPCHALPDSPTKGGETSLYSTEISDAMKVLERFLEWTIMKIDDSDDDGTFHYHVELVTSDSLVSMSDAASVPEAICRAALAAVNEPANT